MASKFKLLTPFWLLALLLIFGTCQKEDGLDVSMTLTAFSIESETKPAIIDDQSKTITVYVGDMMDWTNLSIRFNNGNNTRLVYMEEELVSSLSTLDLTRPVTLSLQSLHDDQKETWRVEVESLIADYGLGNTLHAAANVDKGYTFYFDQYGSGTHQYLNCGPTVTTMTIKWGYPSFAGTPEQARSAIHPNGGWWYTNDIANYLVQNGVNITYADLKDISDREYADRLIDIIDKGYLATLCLDMFYVVKDADEDKRTNKFYTTNAKDWGHFVLVKGYKVVDGTVWLEVHDPYSIGKRYDSDNQYKGENRYYEAVELKKATDIWWPYTIAAISGIVPVLGLRSALTPSQARTIVHQRGR